jgi:hypothetical protein
MRPACIALFLQLCLLPAFATAATPEQEIHEEVQKLFPTMFTKCGDDYFSKQTLDITFGDAYVIGQYKDLAAGIEVRPPSKSDPLNHIQWRGGIRVTASRARSFAHGPALVRRKIVPPDKIDVWGEWKKAALPDYTFHVAKRDGTIRVVKPRRPEISAIPCSDVPKG